MEASQDLNEQMVSEPLLYTYVCVCVCVGGGYVCVW